VVRSHRFTPHLPSTRLIPPCCRFFGFSPKKIDRFGICPDSGPFPTRVREGTRVDDVGRSSPPFLLLNLPQTSLMVSLPGLLVFFSSFSKGIVACVSQPLNGFSSPIYLIERSVIRAIVHSYTTSLTPSLIIRLFLDVLSSHSPFIVGYKVKNLSFFPLGSFYFFSSPLSPLLQGPS